MLVLNSLDNVTVFCTVDGFVLVLCLSSVAYRSVLYCTMCSCSVVLVLIEVQRYTVYYFSGQKSRTAQPHQVLR